MADKPRMIASLEELSGRYGVLLCDVWGVVHNGEAALPKPPTRWPRARARGMAVVLITNSPRPHQGVDRRSFTRLACRTTPGTGSSRPAT